jgi:hypothetical protein
MTTMRVALTALLGSLLAAGAACSHEQKPPQTETITKQRAGTYSSSDLRTLTLQVKSVDAEHHRVTFEATVKPEANVTESGQAIKLDQLKEGDVVRASFDPVTGDLIRVDVTRTQK